MSSLMAKSTSPLRATAITNSTNLPAKKDEKKHKNLGTIWAIDII